MRRDRAQDALATTGRALGFALLVVTVLGGAVAVDTLITF